MFDWIDQKMEEDRLKQLLKLLEKNGLMDARERAINDPAYAKKLFERYGL